MKFLGKKQLVYLFTVILPKLIFCEYVTFGAISCKFVTQIIVIICRTSHFLSTSLIFSLIQISFPNFAFFTIKSPGVTQDWFLKKKKVLKRAKPFRFLSQNYRLKLFLYSNWKQLHVFKIVKFEFKVTVHDGPWAKCTQLWLLNEHGTIVNSHSWLQKTVNPKVWCFLSRFDT